MWFAAAESTRRFGLSALLLLSPSILLAVTVAVACSNQDPKMFFILMDHRGCLMIVHVDVGVAIAIAIAIAV